MDKHILQPTKKLFAILIACLSGSTLFAAEPVQVDLFEAGAGGYETYRIPGVVVTRKGTVLAYCEARKIAKSDWGWIDVMMRRSVDGGITFDAPRKIVEPPTDAAKKRLENSKETLTLPSPGVPGEGSETASQRMGVTVNNPVAIADVRSGAVHFLY